MLNLKKETKDGYEIALQNELAILQIIGKQKWIREDELSLISKFSMAMTRRTCSRLAEKNFIYREKKSAGIFLRLKQAGADLIGTKSGKGVIIPEKWRHDCLAIQVGHFLAEELKDEVDFGSPRFSTDHDFLDLYGKFGFKGKIPDCMIHGDIHIEVEWAKKGGKFLYSQAEFICKEANLGRKVIVAYPHRNDIYNDKNIQISGSKCSKVNHEKTQKDAIRKLWGQNLAPNIRFVQCIFKNEIEFAHARASEFKLIPLPGGYQKTKKIPAALIDERQGFQWRENQLFIGDEIQETITVYWDERKEMYAAILDSTNQVFYDVTEAESFNVFIKNAIVISKHEKMSVEDVIARHIASK